MADRRDISSYRETSFDAPSAPSAPAPRREYRRRPQKEKLHMGVSGFDVPFFMLLVMLTLIGLVMLFSASYSAAYYYYDSPTYFILRQAIFAGIGIIVMFVVMAIPYQILHKLAFPIFITALTLLIVVLLVGITRNNATRWIGVGDFTFQPSEIAKAAVIIGFSSLSVRLGKRMRRFQYGILPFILVIGLFGALLLLQPHLSATIIIAVTGILIIYIAGARTSQVAAISILGISAVVLLVWVFGYQIDRIHVWLNPNIDPQGDGFQILQSLYALGSGGVWGLGLGQSRQKHLFLPEPQNDFIFAIICEELGFVGGALILIIFAAFVIRGYLIALRSRDTFGTLLVAGFVTQIAIQVILNIGVVTGLLPVTGASLPFFSSGGTSLVILFAEMGVVLSVSRQIPAQRKG
jgi:cell division protein FtsW